MRLRRWDARHAVRARGGSDGYERTAVGRYFSVYVRC